MSEHSRARPAAIARLRILTALALAASVAGCWTAPPLPLAGPDPSDPSARTPVVGYRSTIQPYEGRRPVEPLPWREQNERVAPPPKR